MPKFLDLIQYVDNGVKWDNNTNPNDNGSDLRIIKLSQSKEPGTTIMRGPDGTAQISDPNNDLDIANKKYVDDQNTQDVHLTGAQTIRGMKTFNDKTILSGGATVPTNKITTSDKNSVVNIEYMSNAISTAVSTGQKNFSLTIGAGQYSVVQRGTESNAYQIGTASFGGNTVAGDPDGDVNAYSFAFAANENNKAIARSSAAFGRYNRTYNPGEFVCGNYAEEGNRSPETVFLVGGGTTASDRHNAFEVRTSHTSGNLSTAYIGGRMVATQDYVDDYHAANKLYVDNTWNNFNLKNGTGKGSLVQKTVSSSGTPYANEASGSGAVAMGKNAKSNGNTTFVIGQDNEAIAGTSASFTSGYLNVNRGSYNITGGENNANNNSWNLVIGKNNAVSDGRFGIVSGLDNRYTGRGGTDDTAVSMLGNNLYAESGNLPSDGALLIGRYNEVENNTGRLFIVGNGTSPNDRKNAFEVLESGKIRDGNGVIDVHNLTDGEGKGSLIQKTVSSSGTPYANEASGSGAVAMGKKVKSKGNATFVTGQENEAIAGTSASFTSGRLNVNRGSYNITGGENNANNNSWNLVIGKGNAVSDGRFGIVSGLDNRYTGRGGTDNTAVSMLGNNLSAESGYLPSDGALLIGRYNEVENNTGRLFIVGNGTSPNDRRNAFEVLQDGRAKVYKKPQDDDDVVRKLELTLLKDKLKNLYVCNFTTYPQILVQNVVFTWSNRSSYGNYDTIHREIAKKVVLLDSLYPNIPLNTDVSLYVDGGKLTNKPGQTCVTRTISTICSFGAGIMGSAVADIFGIQAAGAIEVEVEMSVTIINNNFVKDKYWKQNDSYSFTHEVNSIKITLSNNPQITVGSTIPKNEPVFNKVLQYLNIGSFSIESVEYPDNDAFLRNPMFVDIVNKYKKYTIYPEYSF